MTTPDTPAARFAELPPRITRQQIADAAGVSLSTINNKWVKESGFPQPTGELGPRNTEYRDRDQVAAWVETITTDPSRRGKKILRPQLTGGRLSVRQIAEGLTMEEFTVYYYIRKFSADSDDPFPVADHDGLRDAGELNAWFAREAQHLRKRGNRGPRPSPRLDATRALLRQHTGHPAPANLIATEFSITHDAATRLLRRAVKADRDEEAQTKTN